MLAGRGGGDRVDGHAAHRILHGGRSIAGTSVAVAAVAGMAAAGAFVLGLMITEQSHDVSFLTVFAIAQIRLANLIGLGFARVEQAQAAGIRHHA